MENERVAAVGMDETEFAAAAKRGDLRAGQPLAEIGRKGPAEAASAQLDSGDAASEQYLFEAADRCFDFGKFWHGGDMADARQGR
jgi:hypothetical protein